MGEKLKNNFVVIDPEIAFKCKTVAEIRLYEQMASMLQSGKTEMLLRSDGYTSEADAGYEKEVAQKDITTTYLNKAIARIGEYGFGQAEYYRVVEKNAGELYLQYAEH